MHLIILMYMGFYDTEEIEFGNNLIFLPV